MAFDQISEVAQIVGVVALIASVIYLAIEVRSNTKIAQSQSHHAVTDSFNQFNTLLTQDERAARIWIAGLQDMESLTPEEQVSMSFMNLGYARIFETLYYQHKNGTMPSELYDAEELTLRWAARQPGWRAWWFENPISLSKEYRDYVNGLIDEELAKEKGAVASPEAVV